jgi:predicted secreted protein
MATGTTGYLGIGRSGFAMALSALFVLTGFAAVASATTTLSAADDGNEVTVSLNATFTIELEEQGSTGYIWDFDDLDRTAVDLLEVTTRTKPDRALVGAPVLKVWTLKAKKVGTTDLKLLYFRSWEGKGKAVKSFRTRLSVVEK